MTLSRTVSRSLAYFISVLTIAASMSACAGEKNGAETEVEGVPLYFEPVGQGHRANLSDTVEAVARNREEWIPISDSLRPPTPFDSVDFSQAILVVAALPQTTSGYSLEFTSVEQLDTVVVAEYLVSVPSDDCLTAHADVVPFQVVLVRRTELPVRFERTVEEYRCTFGPRR